MKRYSHNIAVARYAVALLAILPPSCAPAYPQTIQSEDRPDGSRVITLTKEQARICDAGGGCIIAPVASVEQVIVEAASQMCGAKERNIGVRQGI